MSRTDAIIETNDGSAQAAWPEKHSNVHAQVHEASVAASCLWTRTPEDISTDSLSMKWTPDMHSEAGDDPFFDHIVHCHARKSHKIQAYDGARGGLWGVPISDPTSASGDNPQASVENADHVPTSNTQSDSAGNRLHPPDGSTDGVVPASDQTSSAGENPKDSNSPDSGTNSGSDVPTSNVSPAAAGRLGGFNTFFFDQSDEQIEQTLNEMKAQGINSFRTDYNSDPGNDAVEAVKYAASIGMTPLVVIDSADQATQAAQAFKGLNVNFEFLNEPNAGDVEQYAALTPTEYAAEAKQAYQEVKSIDPQSQFVIGAVAGGAVSDQSNQWIEQVVSQMNGLFDAVSIHPYEVWNGQPDTPQVAQQAADSVASLESALQQDNGGKPVALDITEQGWNTESGQQTWTPQFINDVSSLPYVQMMQVYAWASSDGLGGGSGFTVAGTAAEQPIANALVNFEKGS